MTTRGSFVFPVKIRSKAGEGDRTRPSAALRELQRPSLAAGVWPPRFPAARVRFFDLEWKEWPRFYFLYLLPPTPSAATGLPDDQESPGEKLKKRRLGFWVASRGISVDQKRNILKFSRRSPRGKFQNFSKQWQMAKTKRVKLNPVAARGTTAKNGRSPVPTQPPPLLFLLSPFVLGAHSITYFSALSPFHSLLRTLSASLSTSSFVSLQ